MDNNNISMLILNKLSDEQLIQLALDFDNEFIALDSVLRKVTGEIYNKPPENVTLM